MGILLPRAVAVLVAVLPALVAVLAEGRRLAVRLPSRRAGPAVRVLVAEGC